MFTYFRLKSLIPLLIFWQALSLAVGTKVMPSVIDILIDLCNVIK